ncbi:MAG: DUF4337 domain-containing protein [Bacteroidia bacterium]|nr:DUF4337 domain-containing protein [Bacteroidia bacterium]MDW8301573.1 DUF4337 domain-containing protein [Bacteroidia bacterium]
MIKFRRKEQDKQQNTQTNYQINMANAYNNQSEVPQESLPNSSTQESKPKTRKEIELEQLEKLNALTTSIIAVFLAVTSILNNAAGDELFINLVKTNDSWSFYQAKSIKQSLAESEKDKLEVDIIQRKDSKNPADIDIVQKEIKKVEYYKAKIAEYKREKQEIEKEARKYEREYQNADAKSDKYDIAEGLYQLALVLSPISLVARNYRLWILSCIVGVIALGFSIYAFMMP